MFFSTFALERPAVIYPDVQQRSVFEWVLNLYLPSNSWLSKFVNLNWVWTVSTDVIYAV